MHIAIYLSLCRCEVLPEDDQLDFYDYYAIDIGNIPELIQMLTDVQILLKKTGVYSVSICNSFKVTVSLTEFPPCDPATLKLRPLCETQCHSFYAVVSTCFSEAVAKGIMIAELAAVLDMYRYNCSDPSTHFPGVSIDQFDPQQYCYNVSNYTLGKCTYKCY